MSSKAVVSVGKESKVIAGDAISEPVVIAPGEVSGFYTERLPAATPLDASAIAVSRSAYYITLIAGLNAGWTGALVPAIARSQHIPLDEAGVLASAINGGCLCALAASTPIIGRLGDKNTTLLAAGLTTIAFMGLGLAPGIAAITACAFSYGVGVGLNGIASHIIFPRYYPDRVASALSKLNVFYGVGALVGPMIALACFSAGMPYNWIFIGAGIYAAAVFAYLISTGSGAKANSQLAAEAKQKPLSDVKTAGVPALNELIKHPVLLGLSAINFLYVGIEVTLGTWIYTFLQKADNFDGGTASGAVSLLWVGLALGRVISTKACLKINPKFVTMAAMLLLTGAIFAAAVLHLGAFLSLTLVLMIGLGLGPIFPTIIAQSAMRFPSTSSLSTTLIISAGYFGGMLIPWLMGRALVDLGPLNFMTLTGATAALLPVLLGLTLFSKKLAT